MPRRCVRSWGRAFPSYMVPSAFVVLERLPLTPNGKLDRRRCRRRSCRPRRCAGARTPQEEMLCALFAGVLGLARVGVDDNFFALGGDSIVSIQLVSRARKAGLLITPRAVFQHQTVAALARQLGLVGQHSHASGYRHRRTAGDADNALAAEHGGPIERFHQAMLLRVPAGVQQIISWRPGSVLDHHDALRLRLTGAAARGAWRWLPAGTVGAGDCLRRIDIRGLEEAGLRDCIAEQAPAAEAPAFAGGWSDAAAVWFDAGARRRAGYC